MPRTALLVGVVLVLAVAGGGAARAAVIDNFAGDLSAWTPTMRYGETSGCRASAGEGIDGGSALKVDYDFRAAGTNHIIYCRPVHLDLSFADGISFKVRGTGHTVRVFLFLWDSHGHFNNYGPDGTNPDFITGYADWHECRVLFSRDKSVQGGDADLSDITRIGFMLNDGKGQGTASFCDLETIAPSEALQISSPAFTPNGDGLGDTLTVTALARRGDKVSIEVEKGGQVVRTLQPPTAAEQRRTEVTWEGRDDGHHQLPAGEYTVVARFAAAGAAPVVKQATVTLERTKPWPPIKYTAKPFFPIGVWFEGSPAGAGYPASPAGAAKYYNRCFADMAAHGLNCVAVPNCPQDLWDTLLAAAGRHGIKVVLEVAPLVGLVGSGEPIQEDQIAKAVADVTGQIKGYGSLLRYQIHDEPPARMVPNWVAVQRVLAAYDSAHPAFSCFCSPASLARLAKATTLSEAAFDIYPFRVGMPAGDMGGFFGSLRAFREAAGDVPAWAVLQSFAKPGTWRYPTPDELGCEVWSSLAAGARGVFFFIYQTMPNHPEKLQGLTEPDGRARPIYAPVEMLAREMGKLAPLLMKLEPAGKIQWPQPGGPQAIIGHWKTPGTADEPEGTDYTIVANTNPRQAVAVPLADLLTGNRIGLKDCLTGEQWTLQAGVPTLSVPAGGGRVLVLH